MRGSRRHERGHKGFDQAAEKSPSRLRTLQDTLNAILSMVAVASILLLMVLLVREALQSTIEIEPLSVPKKFAEDSGFVPDIGARVLQDSIYSVFSPVEQITGSSDTQQISNLFPLKGIFLHHLKCQDNIRPACSL